MEPLKKTNTSNNVMKKYCKEEVEKINEETINQTLLDIRVALKNKIKESLKNKENELQKKLSELCDLLASLNEKESEISIIKGEIEETNGKITYFRNLRGTLGIFAGKEKKRIDREIFKLLELSEKLENRYQVLRAEFSKCLSKELVKDNICSFQKELNAIEKELESMKEDNVSRITFEQAVEKLNDKKIKEEFIKKNQDLCENPKIKMYLIEVGDKIEFGGGIWRVLSRERDRILIISDKAISNRKYNDCSDDFITWERCSLRKWLNGDFLEKAFSEKEREKIQDTKVLNGSYPRYNSFSGNETTDKIFLLNFLEVQFYFSTNEDRACMPTQSAANQMVCGQLPALYYDRNRQLEAWSVSNSESKNTCGWWLRSSGSSLGTAMRVEKNGNINFSGFSVLRSSYVRPAMWISIDF